MGTSVVLELISQKDLQEKMNAFPWYIHSSRVRIWNLYKEGEKWRA
jgi:hypothetical protein